MVAGDGEGQVAEVVWFRKDLRVHDNPALLAAMQSGHPVLGVVSLTTYCTTSVEAASFRKIFLEETLSDLSRNLKGLGIRLWVTDLPISDALSQLKQINHVHYQICPGTYEAREAASVSVAKTAYESFTLYQHSEVAISDPMEAFTSFRKRVEKNCCVMAEAGSLSGSNSEGERVAGRFLGGETEGLKRLKHYIWTADRLRVYKETRNGMLEEDDSSKLSPWLALGALSARRVYWEIKRYEAERIANESTYWLFFELLWREFFQHMLFIHGRSFFQLDGVQSSVRKWRGRGREFDAWCAGETGEPLIDACMNELNLTGFMSNRGRQNVASYLTTTLGIDWRLGAEYFERMLIDYDVGSNWGNWQYVAGVGLDPRFDRRFNPKRQAEIYDPKGLYVAAWTKRAEPRVF